MLSHASGDTALLGALSLFNYKLKPKPLPLLVLIKVPAAPFFHKGSVDLKTQNEHQQEE